MRQLFLMRHAKSSWAQETLRDFDRPLNERGREAAIKMGRYMKAEGLIPDQIYCSSTVRTRETLEMLKTASGFSAETLYMDGLYGASRERLFHIIAKASENCRSLLMIGHNPGTQDLAMALAGNVSDEKNAPLFLKFPTASLAVFQLDITHWSELPGVHARLQAFILPKAL